MHYIHYMHIYPHVRQPKTYIPCQNFSNINTNYQKSPSKKKKIAFQERGYIALVEQSIAKIPKWFCISKKYTHKEPHFRCSLYCYVTITPIKNFNLLYISRSRTSKQKHKFYKPFSWFIQCTYFHIILCSYNKKMELRLPVASRLGNKTCL